ncbi:unnamed protein product [Caenorhabditis auriculariae]|uniref:Uncharacterized protein n=1 Tax=Caenorhabditis auriculariae TaxID=2777116 RepID=A0A8S1HCF4_9PELO|nr:unnamed protein product [Caenorhabditis auriculariae]
MELTPRRHELLSVFLLSFGTMFMYLGYDSQSAFAESVVHSVNSRDPGRISSYAGYYGQAIHYISFAFFTFFTASLQYYLSSKWMLVMASSIFTLYYTGYMYINTYIFYFSQCALGFGYAVYNSAEGAYLSEHSSARTIDSNTAFETGIGHMGLFLGGITMFIVLTFVPHKFEGHLMTFTEETIRMIYGSLMALSFVSVIIFLMLPTKQFNSIALNSNNRITPSLRNQFERFGESMKHFNTILLAMTFVYMGCMISFMYGIYPTSLSFTSSSGTDVYMITVYLFSAGIAAFTSAMVLRPMIKRLHKFKLVVPAAVHFIAMVGALTLAYMTVPNNATIRPTGPEEEAYLRPSRTITAIIGFLMGLSDVTITMCRTVICQIAVPDYRAEVFSLTRAYQCVASCVILFVSPVLTMTSWLVILLIGLTIGLGCLITVLCRTHSNDFVAPILPLKEESPEILH